MKTKRVRAADLYPDFVFVYTKFIRLFQISARFGLVYYNIVKRDNFLFLFFQRKINAIKYKYKYLYYVFIGMIIYVYIIRYNYWCSYTGTYRFYNIWIKSGDIIFRFSCVYNGCGIIIYFNPYIYTPSKKRWYIVRRPFHFLWRRYIFKLI